MMGQDGQWSLLGAIYTRLAEDAALAEVLPGGENAIFQYVPENTDYPYVVYRMTEAVPLDTKGHRMLQIGILIEIFTRAESHRQGLRIAGAVRAAIEGGLPEMEEYIAVDCRFVRSLSAVREEREVLRETVAYSVLIEPKH